MNARFGPGTMPPNTFYYDDTNQENEPNEKWNLFLGNLGILPKEAEKHIYDMFDDDHKSSTKYVIGDISQAIMEQNIEIWKYRCKRLYGPINNTNINEPP